MPGSALGVRAHRQGDVQNALWRGDVRDRRCHYVPPGHTPVLYAGTEIIEFSTTEQLQQTLDVVTKNMEAAG